MAKGKEVITLKRVVERIGDCTFEEWQGVWGITLCTENGELGRIINIPKKAKRLHITLTTTPPRGSQKHVIAVEVCRRNNSTRVYINGEDICFVPAVDRMLFGVLGGWLGRVYAAIEWS